MKSLLSHAFNNPLAWLKKITVIGLVFTWLIFPELLWHKLSIILHLLYESFSFVMEEILIHGFGMKKNYAQMSVFYLSWLVVILFCFRLWCRLPHLIVVIKIRYESYRLKAKHEFGMYWLSLSFTQKLKFLLIQFAGLATGFMFLLS